MNPAPNLADAVALAARAHRTQRDRAGQPYILHPLRVMLRQTDETSQIVAVLHDVLEDSEITADALRDAGYSETIVAALETLTERKDETYEQFIERIEQHPLARGVKISDLEDNMNLQRLPDVGAEDLHRAEKYHKAWRRLVKRSAQGR